MSSIQPTDPQTPPEVPATASAATLPSTTPIMPAAISPGEAPTTRPALPLARPSKLRGPAFWLAGLGGAAALVGYFALPLATLNYSFDFSSLFGSLGSLPGDPSGSGISPSQFMPNLCPSGGCALTGTAAQGLSGSGPGTLTVLPFLAALALVIALFPAVRNRALGLLTPRNGAVACVLASAVGLLVLYNQATQADSSLSQSLSALSSFMKVNSSLSLGAGFWVMVGGLGAMLIGGLGALLFSRNA